VPEIIPNSREQGTGDRVKGSRGSGGSGGGRGSGGSRGIIVLCTS